MGIPVEMEFNPDPSKQTNEVPFSSEHDTDDYFPINLFNCVNHNIILVLYETSILIPMNLSGEKLRFGGN